jgi:predicted DNA-binding ribbon-helix-helix protein
MVMSVFELPKKPARDAATYEQDIYSWAMQQAEIVRARRWDELDIANVVEELESLARTEYRSLVSALRVLMLHMLKWDHQPEKRSRSWLTSIVAQRGELADVLADNPGLKPRLVEAMQRAYAQARREAAAETGLRIGIFPGECPYDVEALANRPFDLDAAE